MEIFPPITPPEGIKINEDEECLSFEAYTVLKPEETKSGKWEVWSMDQENRETLNSLMLTLEFPEGDYGPIHLVIAALQLGAYHGERKGRSDIQNSLRFALSALSGNGGIDDLIEAAAQNDYVK